MKSLKKWLRDFLIRSRVLGADLSEEELREVLHAGRESGAIGRTEQELITSILEFSDITVKEIMVPRPDIVALDISMPRDALVRKVIEEGYTRLPVFQGSIDRIIGIIYTKDLLSLLEHRDLIILQDILRPVYFVPESKKISQLLREFQQRKVHLGVVVDEFGGTEGIVTFEDIIEEIVGDILDEYDEVHRSVQTVADGSTLVDGALSVSDFNSQFSTKIPENADYETLAGFLNQISGRLPEVNDEISYGRVVFTIVSKSARRIRQVKVNLTALPTSGGGMSP